MLAFLNENFNSLRQSFSSPVHSPQSFSENKRRFLRNCLIIVCAIFLISEVFYLLRRFDVHSGDLTLYYSIVSQTLDGKVPFRDFTIEYPVLSLIPILLPGLVNHLIWGGFAHYCFLFAAQNILLSILTGYIISVTRIPGIASKDATLTYALLSVLALPLYLFRFDGFPILLTSILIYSIFHKPFISGLAFAASIMAKLYPIVIGPALALYFLVNWALKEGFIYLAGVAVFLIISLGIILPIASPAIFNFLQSHQVRGIQIESIVGGLLLLANLLDVLGVAVTHNYGSFNIDSSVSQSFAHFLKFGVTAMFTLLFLFQSWLFVRERKLKGFVSEISLVFAASMWLLSFLIFNKVLSPQYLLWLFPVISFLNQEIKIKFAVALMLTITIFPGWYHYLTNLNPLLVIALNIRNLMLIWILSDIIKIMVKQVFTNPTDRSPPIKHP
jgi:hypothetical protein